jgi:Amt family ammonium transporter
VTHSGHPLRAGGVGFALEGISECDFAAFFFQFTFAATAATIVSGAMAERVQIEGYIVYAVLITGFIYPVVTYWTWSGNAWLVEGDSSNENVGFTDFAGSGIVHMTGGTASLVGAWMIGPRLRRIGEKGEFLNLGPHSTPLIALGTFILMFGFLAFK